MGFRVWGWGLGFRAGGLGFRVLGLVFSVWGLGFRNRNSNSDGNSAEGLRFGVEGLGLIGL